MLNKAPDEFYKMGNLHPSVTLWKRNLITIDPTDTPFRHAKYIFNLKQPKHFYADWLDLPVEEFCCYNKLSHFGVL